MVSPLVASESLNYALPTSSRSLFADHASQFLAQNFQIVSAQTVTRNFGAGARNLLASF
jgi:hypothetical protein